MALFMKGQSVVTKLASLVEYVVFPGVMIATCVYSPPAYLRTPADSSNEKSSTNHASCCYSCNLTTKNK
ncbi:hypothetical protein SAY86_006440 [Trapa natans]|uniref:Uncharacterized protein n=1 Tax=Trapa natans TaxID=22666 RepID=A0AAN7LE16_TRANT|nr:hypothetical protein SAY86_006440 [Trapa natans]